MRKSIELNGKEYEINLVEESDEAGNKASVLLLTNGDDKLRFSPNTTEEELEAYADPKQKGHE